jgi:hypothetical protein
LTELAVGFLGVFALPPVEFVNLAAGLGCQHISTIVQGQRLVPFDFRPFSLRDPALRKDLLAAMNDRSVTISLCDGFLVRPGADVRNFCADLEVLAELAVPRINVVSLDPDLSRTFDQFGALTELGAQRKIETDVEPVPGLTIGDLPTAVAAVEHRSKSGSHRADGLEGLLFDVFVDDQCGPGRHFAPQVGQIGQRLRNDNPGISTEVDQRVVIGIEHLYRLQIFADEQRIYFRTAGVASGVQANPIADPHRHLERRFTQIGRGSGRFDKTCHAGDPGDRIIGETEGKCEVKQQLRIGGTRYVAEQVGVHSHEQLPTQPAVSGDVSVVHEKPIAVPERVAVGLLHRCPGARAHVRKKQRGADRGGQFQKVLIAPRRGDAAKAGIQPIDTSESPCRTSS